MSGEERLPTADEVRGIMKNAEEYRNQMADVEAERDALANALAACQKMELYDTAGKLAECEADLEAAQEQRLTVEEIEALLDLFDLIRESVGVEDLSPRLVAVPDKLRTYLEAV